MGHVEAMMRSVQGGVLDAVTVHQHWYAEQPNGEVTAFWLRFSDGRVLHFHGDGGGQRLLVDQDVPGTSVDLAEYGQMRVEPVHASHALAGFIGCQLEDSAPICSRVQGCETGIRLRFDRGPLSVLEYCDDLWIFIGETLPDLTHDKLSIGRWPTPERC